MLELLTATAVYNRWHVGPGAYNDNKRGMDLYCCRDLILLQADMSMAVRLSIRKLHRPLQWRHNGHDGVSNHQPHHCLLNRLFSADQRKYQSSASLAFCAVNSPHKWPVTWKMFPFDDVIMHWLRGMRQCQIAVVVQYPGLLHYDILPFWKLIYSLF